MTLRGLLSDTANILIQGNENQSGRVETTWEVVTTIKCRVTQPAPSHTIVADGGIAPRVDATIFALPEVASILDEQPLPIRFEIPDGYSEGLYEMRKPPRVYGNAGRASHVEIDVQRVEYVE